MRATFVMTTMTAVLVSIPMLASASPKLTPLQTVQNEKFIRPSAIKPMVSTKLPREAQQIYNSASTQPGQTVTAGKMTGIDGIKMKTVSIRDDATGTEKVFVYTGKPSSNGRQIDVAFFNDRNTK